MSLKKSVCVVSVGALVGALVYGCSSSSSPGGTTGDDAGAAADTSVHDTGVTDSAHPNDAKMEAAVACAPGDVSTFMPPAYVHVNRQTVCSNQNIADFFSECVDSTTRVTATCNTFKAANAACSACLEGPSTAATWGATVTHNGVISVNVAGCMEVLGGADGLACAQKSQALEACGDAACDATCPVTDDASFQLYLACIQQADANGCSTAATALQTCETAISGGDGGAASCNTGTDFPTFYNIVAPIICGGGGSSDAGPG